MAQRILIVHNAYRQRGGEDAVVEAEAALLRERGHPVVEYRRHNDELIGAAPLALAADTLWSRRTVAEVGALLARERPELIHVHNTFPLISPSLYWVAARAGVPVVQTLHNFRLACPQAMFLRAGRVCEDCLGRLPLAGVARGCYRGSRAHSAVLAGMLGAHRALGTWRRKVARYIALNDFCRDKFIEAGLPAGRIAVKPNFVDLPRAPAGPRQGLLFVGRLAPEKGGAVLAEALALAGHPPCRVAGEGPEAPRLAGLPGVAMLGALPPAEVLAEMGRAQAVLLPSLWYENFPRTLVEAYAAGAPVIASRLGALAELVEEGRTGLLFEPGDAADLAAKLAWATAHPEAMAEMGARARARYEALYTPERNYRQLLAIYQEARAATPGDGHA